MVLHAQETRFSPTLQPLPLPGNTLWTLLISLQLLIKATAVSNFTIEGTTEMNMRAEYVYESDVEGEPRSSGFDINYHDNHHDNVAPTPFYNISKFKNELPKNLSVYPTVSGPLFRPVFTTIKYGERHSYSYPVNGSVIKRWPALQLQFYGETEDENLDNRLLVTVYWLGSIRSWEIPVHRVKDVENLVHKTTHNRFADLVIGKTIWNYPARVKGDGHFSNLTVEFSVASNALVYYKLRIELMKNFAVNVEKSVVGMATPASPAFFWFRIPPKSWEYYFIHVLSDSDTCAVMTVQQLRGPFLESVENSQETQYSETFTMKSGLTLKAADFPNGFLIVFLPFENDMKCKSRSKFWNTSQIQENDPFRLKNLTFQIREGGTPIKYLGAIFMPLLLFVAVSVVVLAILFCSNSLKRRCMMGEYGKSLIQRRFTTYQSKLTINDLITTEPSRVVGQTRRYCRAGFVTSAFYSVPVFQLIFTFSKQLLDSGNFDICYFNHFCSHSLGFGSAQFHDFNHMYSNIWYVLFGLLYILVVWIRQMMMTHVPDPPKDMEKETENGWKNPFAVFPQSELQTDHGVMTHYGLLYCMGFALIMTGVMSSAYHICPNQSNFQFDTVFMYTIAAITVVTIYQSRHPTYLSANFTFTALALVTCITVLGLLWEELFIRVIFSVVHLLFLLLSLPKVCYNGYVRKNNRIVAHWTEVMSILSLKLQDDLKQHRILRIQHYVWKAPDDSNIIVIPGPGRLLLPGFLLIINCLAITAMWTILLNQNFATQVLFICVMNGALYILFYSMLKMYHGECRRILWFQPAFYILISIGLWGYAMCFFFDEVSNWEKSPAESRMKNRDCMFLSFYDSHDLWHFLSAAALFSSAMVLLTVDDDLVDQPKSTIPVF